MSKFTVDLPYKYYPDPTKGKPVYLGYIYIGEPNTDPEIVGNQKTVTIDGTTPISQPIRTSAGGVPDYNGAAATLFVDGPYSIKVMNSKGVQVYYAATVLDDIQTQIEANTALIEGNVKNFATLAEAVAETDTSRAFDGAAANLKERTTGNGGGAMWDYVDISSVTVNTFNIVACTGDASLALVMRNAPSSSQWGALGLDDTLAIQAIIDSDIVNIYIDTPSNITSTLHVTKIKKISSINGGKLNVGTGMGSSDLISIEVDGCVIDGLEIDNPNELKTQSGGKQQGLSIKANKTSVINCVIRKMLTGVTVEPQGEYFDTRIVNNNFVDMLGAGDGPADALSSLGEDRGDAIVSWGARNIITGNNIALKDGQDGRVGIHVESLKGLIPVPSSDDNRASTISNNIIKGAYRRHITDESMWATVITSNVCDGGMTWWGINTVQGRLEKVISNNIIRYDRMITDETGKAWSPRHAATLSLGQVEGSNNIVKITNAGGRGLDVYSANLGAPLRHVNLQVSIYADDIGQDVTFSAIDIVYGENINVSKAKIVGRFLTAISAFNSQWINCDDSDISGTKDWAVIISNVTGQVSTSRLKVKGCLKGIDISGSSNISANSNEFQNMGSTDAISLFNNAVITCQNNLFNGGDGKVITGGSTEKYLIENNVGFSDIAPISQTV